MVNPRPLVSIIIPVYNVEKYLQECLNSVFGQTYENIEVICVDDGSTDASPDILEHCRQKQPRMAVIRQENQGQSVARNTGMEIMKGEYLLFVDSDDFIAPQTVESCIKAVLQNNGDAVYFQGVHFSRMEVTAPMHSNFHLFLKTGSFPNTSQHLTHYINSVLIFYKTSIIQTYGLRFIPKIFCEDWAFAHGYLALIKNAHVLDSAFYFYRHNRASTTYKPTTEWHLTIFDAVAASKKALVDGGIWQYHRAKADYLSVSHLFGFYNSKSSAMPLALRQQWEAKLREFMLAYNSTYRLWLWGMIGRPRKMRYIIENDVTKIELLNFLEKTESKGALKGVFVGFEYLIRVPIHFALGASEGVKSGVKIILRLLGRSTPFPIHHIRHFFNHVCEILVIPIHVYWILVNFLEFFIKLAVFILKKAFGR